MRNILPVVQLRHFERLRPESLVGLRVGVLNLALFGAVPLLTTVAGLSLVTVCVLGAVVSAAYLFLILGGHDEPHGRDVPVQRPATAAASARRVGMTHVTGQSGEPPAIRARGK